MSGITREKKYQIIRAYQAGKISLTDLKALAKLGSVGSLDEYMKASDKKHLLKLEGGIHRLLQTRGDAKRLAEVRFTERKLPQNREDFIGAYYSGFNKKINWKREDYMKRKKGRKRAEPRIGSSKGKIGKTTVIGAKKVLTDFEQLVKSLQALQRSGNATVRDGKALQAKMKAIRTSIRPSS